MARLVGLPGEGLLCDLGARASQSPSLLSLLATKTSAAVFSSHFAEETGALGLCSIRSWESPMSARLPNPSSHPITTSQGSRESDGAAFEPGVGLDFPEKWNWKQLGNNSAVLLSKDGQHWPRAVLPCKRLQWALHLYTCVSAKTGFKVPCRTPNTPGARGPPSLPQ